MTAERTGDDFVAFVEARQTALLRSAYLICGDHHLAQDLLQEALVKLAARWERIRDEQPEGYVRKILYRDTISRWRRSRREHLVDPADPAGVLAPLEALRTQGRPGSRGPRSALPSPSSRRGSGR